MDKCLRLLMDQSGRLGHRQDGAQLVVHQHHGHQHRVRPQGPLQVVQGDIPRPVGLEIGDLIPLPLQGLAGLQHGGVLIGGGDDVLSGAAAQLHRPLDGPVVPLGAAGGKEKLLRPAPQAGGNLGPVVLHRLRRLGTQGVPGGGIPPPLGHGLHRRLDGLRPHGGGGRVVKIVDQTPSPRNIGFWQGISPEIHHLLYAPPWGKSRRPGRLAKAGRGRYNIGKEHRPKQGRREDENPCRGGKQFYTGG